MILCCVFVKPLGFLLPAIISAVQSQKAVSAYFLLALQNGIVVYLARCAPVVFRDTATPPQSVFQSHTVHR